jgi:hypothetical protein
MSNDADEKLAPREANVPNHFIRTPAKQHKPLQIFVGMILSPAEIE